MGRQERIVLVCLFKVTEFWLQTSHSSREAKKAPCFWLGTNPRLALESRGTCITWKLKARATNPLIYSSHHWYPYFSMPAVMESWEQGPQVLPPSGCLKASPPHLWGTALAFFVLLYWPRLRSSPFPHRAGSGRDPSSFFFLSRLFSILYDYISMVFSYFYKRVMDSVMSACFGFLHCEIHLARGLLRAC